MSEENAIYAVVRSVEMKNQIIAELMPLLLAIHQQFDTREDMIQCEENVTSLQQVRMEEISHSRRLIDTIFNNFISQYRTPEEMKECRDYIYRMYNNKNTGEVNS